MTAINRTTDAVTEPVTLQQLKDQARILHDKEDTLLETYLLASRQRCEDAIGQAFVTQTWELAADRWPARSNHHRFRELTLPRPPLKSISSVVYTNSVGTDTTMPSSDYQADIKSKPGRVAPVADTFWPIVKYQTLNPIVVTFVAGYGTAGGTDANSIKAIPQTIKQAILMYATYMYRVRDVDAPMPGAVEDLLRLADFGSYRYEAPDHF